MKTTQTKSATLNYNVTAKDLRDWLGTVPDNARISIHVTKGDRPWESGETTVKATWDD